MQKVISGRSSERGSAGLKFLGVVVVLGLIINAALNYVPAAYEAESLKSDMNTAVLQGLATPGKIDPVQNVKERIQRAMTANNVPENAILEVKPGANNIVSARVAYSKYINILPFGIYRYTYVFDSTATPSGMLLSDAKSMSGNTGSK